MAKSDTVKCKGCGCEVWVGSKMQDGYCHDCYSRGRHLPPDIDDPFQPQKKKPKPAPIPKPTTQPAKKKIDWSLPWRFIQDFFRRFRWKAVLVVLIIALGLWFGIPALINTFNRPTGEANTMKTLRDLKYSDFINRGERIPAETLPGNAEAITAFMSGGESYRMNGIFEYAFYDYTDLGREKKARTNIEMSYNGEHDVYKFKITNNGFDAEKLEQFHIADGTYYIVKENDKTYLLYHGGGKRTATDISEDRAVYDFLLDYVMGNLVKTDFFTNADYTRHLWDGDFYSISHSDVGDGMTVYGGQHRTELRTYKHKPLVWYDCNRDKDTMIEWQIKVDYYYDNISRDAPSVADYK